MNKHYEKQKAYYGEEYSSYRSYQLDNWRQSYLQRIFEALQIRGQGQELCLDVGVGGSGYTVIEAARLGVTAVGCDLSIEGIIKAKTFASQKGVADKAFFVVASAEALPFRDDVFSKVSSIAVLEHLPRDRQAVEEMARVCRPEALIFVTVPNTFKRVWPLLWLPSYLHDRRVGHLRHYSEENLTELFSSKGFRCERVFYTGHLVKLPQLLLNILPLSTGLRDKLWWLAEKRDLSLKQHRMALNLHAVFIRS